MIKKIKSYLTIEEIKKFIKFGTVGVLNTGVDWGVFFLFSNVFMASVYVSQIFAYVIATTNSYILNRAWTFKSKSKKKTIEIAKFLTVNLISLSISLIAMYIFHDVLGLNKLICKCIIACFTIVVNYLGNRLWVFKKSQDLEGLE